METHISHYSLRRMIQVVNDDEILLWNSMRILFLLAALFTFCVIFQQHQDDCPQAMHFRVAGCQFIKQN